MARKRFTFFGSIQVLFLKPVLHRFRVHLCFANIFVGAKHSGRQFISDSHKFRAGMLRPYKIGMLPRFRRSLRLFTIIVLAGFIAFFAVNVKAQSISNLAKSGVSNSPVSWQQVDDLAVISNPLASELLNSLFSSFASFAPSRLNHSDTTGIGIIPGNLGMGNESRSPQAWENLARTSYAAGEFAEAAKYWRQAVAGFAAGGDWLNQAIALGNLSLTYQQLGDWKEANSAIAKSRSLLPEESKVQSPGELKAIGQILDIQSNGEWEQGQINLALETGKQATNIYVKLKDNLGWKRSLIAQVKTLQELGLYQQACQAIIPVVESSNSENFVIPSQDCQQLISQKLIKESVKTPSNPNLKNIQITGARLLGDVWRQLGYLKESQQLLEELERVVTQQESPQEQALVLLSLGDTYQALGNRNNFLSELNQSEEYYQKARKSYEKSALVAANNSFVKVQGQLNLLSLLVKRKSEFTENGKEIEKLRLEIWSQLSKLPPSHKLVYAEVNLMNSLVEFNNQLKTPNPVSNSSQLNAEKIFNYCLPNSAMAAENVLGNMASVSWGEVGRLGAKAIALARDLGDFRATAYALGNLGTVYEKNQQWLEAQQCTEQALLLSQNVSLNAPDLAYQWQWQLGRIRWLGEAKDVKGAIEAYTAAFNTLQSLRNDFVPISRDGQFDFRDRVEPVYREFVDLLLQEEKPNQDNLKQARNVIEALQVAELDNFFRDGCIQIKTKQIDGIDRTAAVIYPIILEDRLEVIVSLPNQLLHHRSSSAPRKKVEELIKKLQQELSEAGERAEVPKISKFFYDWLIEPFNKYLRQYPDVKTLVFVLDGSLRNIPMGVLYDYDEVTQKGNFLIEKYAIALAPGLQLISPNTWQPERLKVLIAGLSEERTFPGRTPFPALKYINQELGNLKKEVPSSEKSLINQDFLKNSLRDEINSLRSSVVHIATHGEFSSDPEQTFIVAYDDLIQSKELSDILRGRRAGESNSIELLVLSACKTAKGDPRAALGLAGVAVRSGARSTLATLWYVDDESTTEVMIRFYNELKKPNVNKAEALRQAQLSLLAKQPDSYYWAPFVMLGNWL